MGRSLDTLADVGYVCEIVGYYAAEVSEARVEVNAAGRGLEGWCLR